MALNVWLTSAAGAQEALEVISGKSHWLQHTDAKNSLYHHFADEAFGYLKDRRQQIADIKSLSQWQERQKWIKESLLEVVGTFPKRTPLDAKVVKTLEKENFRVEHIIFESQPRFFVTSSLFIPGSLKENERAPVIIYCSGHSENGYRSQVYQRVILNLVKKGFIVFAFDPVGQGERLEYFDPATNKSRVGGPTSEHSYPGAQAFISGASQAQFMIWDGLRAVDYLLTRKEVDPDRIGITGRSGGGTQASYIAAMDDRIYAAAPECYITNFTRLLQSIGPQDAEQNFPSGVRKGLDHGDLLMVRAPKPTLMITTTRDMFSIQGARETAEEVRRIYGAYKNEDAFGMIEDDAPHASTKKNREAMYAFFQKHLQNPGDPADEDVAILTEDEIRVTTTGQVSTSLSGETVHTLTAAHVRNIRALPAETNYSGNMAEVKRVCGYKEPSPEFRRVFTGRIQREGYTIEKYFLPGEGNYVIPYLAFTPATPWRKILLYLHPSGKSVEALPGGEIEWFVKKGFLVLAPDLAGMGELGAGDFQGDAYIDGMSHNIWYSAILVGRSIAGVHAADIIRILNSVATNPATPIYALARKELTPALLHAAAFHPRIEKVALVDALLSYRSLTLAPAYQSSFIIGAVAGSLPVYDLPTLAASLAPRKLLIINAQEANGQQASDPAIEEAYAPARNTYNQNHSGQMLIISSTHSREHLRNVLAEWAQ